MDDEEFLDTVVRTERSFKQLTCCLSLSHTHTHKCFGLLVVCVCACLATVLHDNLLVIRARPSLQKPEALEGKSKTLMSIGNIHSGLKYIKSNTLRILH